MTMPGKFLALSPASNGHVSFPSNNLIYRIRICTHMHSTTGYLENSLEEGGGRG